MKIAFCLAILFVFNVAFSFTTMGKLGCDNASQDKDIATLKSQGYEIKKTFQTNVLTYEYGGNKYFELMPAYEMESKEGVIKYATCVGLFNSSLRSGTYISNSQYGAYVKIIPYMDPFYEMKFEGVRITGDLKYGTVPSFTPYNGELDKADVKFNDRGEVRQVLFHREGSREYWGEVKRLMDPQCLNVQLPFSEVFLSASSTKSSQEEARKAVYQEMEEKFIAKKNECEESLGEIAVCKETRYPDSVTGRTKIKCTFKDMDGTDNYAATKSKIDFSVPNQVTYSLLSYGILCKSLDPWRMVEIKKCLMNPVDPTPAPIEPPKLVGLSPYPNRYHFIRFVGSK